MDSHPIETLGRRLLRKKRSLILSGMTAQTKSVPHDRNIWARAA
jgi:hypothetical protein